MCGSDGMDVSDGFMYLKLDFLGFFLEIIKHGKKGCLKMTFLKPIFWNFSFQVLESVTKNSVLMYIYILTLYRYSYIFKQNCNVLYYIDHKI